MKAKNQSDDVTMHDARATPRSNAEWAVQRLRELGQRVTSQRLAVLMTFRPGEHVTAEEVCARLAADSKLADRSTVYRILEHFRDLGVVSEVDLGDGARSYELLAAERHHHLVCLTCKMVIALEDEVVAPLRRAIDERHNFHVRLDHLAIFGLCAACAHHERARADSIPSGA